MSAGMPFGGQEDAGMSHGSSFDSPASIVLRPNHREFHGFVADKLRE